MEARCALPFAITSMSGAEKNSSRSAISPILYKGLQALRFSTITGRRWPCIMAPRRLIPGFMKRKPGPEGLQSTTTRGLISWRSWRVFLPRQHKRFAARRGGADAMPSDDPCRRLIETMYNIPASDEYEGRTELLRDISFPGTRSNNKRTDLSNMVYSLRDSYGPQGERWLYRLIENAKAAAQ